jgi:pimeloyl-ACP methyl ester carboxylesterase
MAEHMPGDPDADDRFVRLDDSDMHVVQDGKPGAPALLLIQNAAVPTACWDSVVPRLAGAYHVIRVDLLGHGRLASPADGYDIPAQARRAGAVLDMLGVSRLTVIGHSSGCTMATALGMTHRAFAGAMRAPLNYLGQRSLPDRLTALGLPVLVIFGVDDQRWRSSSAAAYRVVSGARVELLPGVGHTPMLEDPQATGTLLLDFAAAAAHRS